MLVRITEDRQKQEDVTNQEIKADADIRSVFSNPGPPRLLPCMF